MMTSFFNAIPKELDQAALVDGCTRFSAMTAGAVNNGRRSFACLSAARSDAAWVDQAFDFLGRLPEEPVDIGRGVKAPRWYRGMTHVNLPDTHVGYAVMDVDETGVALQTVIRQTPAPSPIQALRTDE